MGCALCSQTVECMDLLARETPIQTVLVDGMRLSVIRSRYNSDTRIVEQVELYNPRILGAGGGSEEAAVREHLLQKERELAQVRVCVFGGAGMVCGDGEKSCRIAKSEERSGGALGVVAVDDQRALRWLGIACHSYRYLAAMWHLSLRTEQLLQGGPVAGSAKCRPGGECRNVPIQLHSYLSFVGARLYSVFLR